MNVVYSIRENETGIFEIYDLLGKSLFRNLLTTGKNSFIVNATELNAGIYTYRAYINDKKISEDKIVIIK